MARFLADVCLVWVALPRSRERATCERRRLCVRLHRSPTELIYDK